MTAAEMTVSPTPHVQCMYVCKCIHTFPCHKLSLQSAVFHNHLTTSVD